MGVAGATGRFRRLDLDRPGRAVAFLLVAGILMIGLAIAVGLALTGILRQEVLTSVDRPVTVFLATHREPLLSAAMKGITAVGAPLTGLVILGVVAVLVYRGTPNARWLLFLVLALLGGNLLDNVVKAVVDRPRPQIAPLVEAAGSSFPSGHATAATAMIGGVALLLARRGQGASLWVWSAAGVLACAVALSRVYLGVHWPTDVLAGLALGGGWVAVAAAATLPAARLAPVTGEGTAPGSQQQPGRHRGEQQAEQNRREQRVQPHGHE